MNTRPTAVNRPARGSDALARGAAPALARLVGGMLLAFHLWLLGLHLLDGRAFEPATAARWGLAVLVLAGFRALRRRGVPLFSGRRAVVLWLLVALIHCGATWDGGAAVFESAIPESAVALAQLSLATTALGIAVAIALALAAVTRAGAGAAFPVPSLIAGLPADGIVFRFSPRPPPRA